MSVDLSTILRGVLSAASSALNEADRPTGRVELTPGLLPAWDDCCDGQLYLRVIEIYPSVGVGSPFPQIDTTQRGPASSTCSIKMLAVHIGLGVLRCAATVDEQGNSPTSSQVSEDEELILADMSTLLDVLVCESHKLPGIQQMKLDRWQPQGPQGGCAGGEWGAYFAVDPCLCQR